MAAIKVLLVDDHQMVRAGLAVLLRNAGFDVVGEASNGRLAVDYVRQHMPDVVVMDLRMPELNGFDATRQAIAIKPDVKVIGLSANTDERSASEMVRAGAVGYIAKEAAHEELIAAIRAVVENKAYFSPSVTGHALSTDHDKAPASTTVFDTLSSREREVLQLIAEGSAMKEIARALNVSVKTVETHRRNLMEKLHKDSVAELTKYAIREGLTNV